MTIQANQQIEIAKLTDGCQRVNEGLARATFERKRELIELLVDRVVMAHEEVEICYVILTSERGENRHLCQLHKDSQRVLSRNRMAFLSVPKHAISEQDKYSIAL